MADIVIRGVDVPKGDLEYVSLWVYGDGRVYVSNKASAASSQRLQDLAIPLPEGHGRLIDTDELDYTMLYKENWMRGTGVEAPAIWKSDIDAADTIVPAEGG